MWSFGRSAQPSWSSGGSRWSGTRWVERAIGSLTNCQAQWVSSQFPLSVSPSIINRDQSRSKDALSRQLRYNMTAWPVNDIHIGQRIRPQHRRIERRGAEASPARLLPAACRARVPARPSAAKSNGAASVLAPSLTEHAEQQVISAQTNSWLSPVW